jgi:hypothetical protein
MIILGSYSLASALMRQDPKTRPSSLFFQWFEITLRGPQLLRSEEAHWLLSCLKVMFKIGYVQNVSSSPEGSFLATCCSIRVWKWKQRGEMVKELYRSSWKEEAQWAIAAIQLQEAPATPQWSERLWKSCTVFFLLLFIDHGDHK